MTPAATEKRLREWMDGGDVHAAVIVAHPDDEVIGAGIGMTRLKRVSLLHVTDGAPLEMNDALAAGCGDRESYARLRRRELEAALEAGGIHPQVMEELGVTDQHASLDLPGLTHRMAAWLERTEPDVVITHPYEGGHPDHDAVAFAVHHAAALFGEHGRTPPAVLEMTSYHNGPAGLTCGCFLSRRGCTEHQHVLTTEQRRLKERMLSCFKSQRQTLKYFDVEEECFRAAPAYDFTAAPHPGLLFYENYNWGVTGAQWRRLAREAMTQLTARMVI